VRAGPIDADTFVVSYEAVPPWQEFPQPDPPTYTFQAALHSDGRVEFLYGDMGPLPGHWTIGLSGSGERAQELACHREPLALAGKRWEVVNQALPGDWLGAEPASMLLPPGASRHLNVVFTGRGAAWLRRPFSAVLRLRSNDPSQPSYDLPAEATIAPAEFSVFYPRIGH